MHETSKAVQRRLHDANFISRYFRGRGIDIGAGDDPLGAYIELFPLMKSCESWDKADGNAETMASRPDEFFDFVHSSHCLEHMHSPDTALKNWFRILAPGGHLIVLVPDEDMYEQGVWPSTFNSDHKWTFTVRKSDSWSHASLNVVDLVGMLGDAADIIKIEQLTGSYRFELDRQDQTRSPIGEAAIEFIIRKRLESEPQAGGNIGRIARADRSVGGIERMKATRPKIALHRPGAIGDIIMTLSLVPLLKEKYPDHEIHYFAHPAIGKPLSRLMQAAGVSSGFDMGMLEQKKHEYENVINLVGYPLKEGYPEKPMARHLIRYFADEMGVDIQSLPHLTIDPGPKHVAPERYATIHPQAGWSVYKNWKHERWEEVIAEFPDMIFYQIGGENDRKLAGADTTFLGQPLDASIDLMAHATLHLGVDSWTNHLTNIWWKGRGFPDSSGGFTPAIILWGSTQVSAAGYARNTNISLGLSCQPCFREDPAISRMPRGPCINPPGQDYEHPHHACMEGIMVSTVTRAIERLWNASSHQ